MMRRLVFVLPFLFALGLSAPARAELFPRFIEARLAAAWTGTNVDAGTHVDYRRGYGGAVALDVWAPLQVFHSDLHAVLFGFGAELGIGSYDDVTGGGPWGIVRWDFGGGYVRSLSERYMLSLRFGFSQNIDTVFAQGSELLGAEYGFFLRARLDAAAWSIEAEAGGGAGSHERLRARSYLSPSIAWGAEVANYYRGHICDTATAECLATIDSIDSRQQVTARLFLEWSYTGR